MRRAIIWAFLGVLVPPTAASADEVPVTPAGGPFHRRATVAPPYSQPYCPPGAPVYPPDYPPVYPPGTTQPMVPPLPPGATEPPPMPPVPPDRDPLTQLTTPFAQPTEAGGQPSRTFNENFDGDFAGVYYRQRVSSNSRGQLLQLGSLYNGVQFVDNGNPRPTDQLFFTYNYFDNAGGSLSPNGDGSNIARQMIGFEKTFLDGDASFGMRLPFIQQDGPGTFNNQVVGDLTLLVKYAVINNRDNGNLVSLGMSVTTPTGGANATLSDGTQAPHSVLFQPFIGFVKPFERFYIQGVTNLIAPTEARDPTIWGNSLGLGYYLYRSTGDRFLTAITPVVEVHVRTPLNHRSITGIVYLQDQVNVTSGMHVRFRRAVLSGAVCAPLASTKPWNLEAMGFFSYQF